MSGKPLSILPLQHSVDFDGLGRFGRSVNPRSDDARLKDVYVIVKAKCFSGKDAHWRRERHVGGR